MVGRWCFTFPNRQVDVVDYLLNPGRHGINPDAAPPPCDFCGKGSPNVLQLTCRRECLSDQTLNRRARTVMEAGSGFT
jgi:hypothetical protein